MQIAIIDVGFGPAPDRIGDAADLATFSFHHHNGSTTEGDAGTWEGGHNGVQVTIRYVSWTDRAIPMAGYDGAHGEGRWSDRPSDPVTITNAASGLSGAWSGTLP